MLEELKRRVYKANMMLPQYHLVTFTWGNASEIDSATGLVAIKPSGVPYDELSRKKWYLLIFKEMWLEGEYKPSSDMPNAYCLYKLFGNRWYCIRILHMQPAGHRRVGYSLLWNNACRLYLW